MNIQRFADALTTLDSNPPSFRMNEKRHDALLRIGRFFEESIRPGREYDLRQNPGPLRRLVEPRLVAAARDVAAARLGSNQVTAWQMYNHGVIVKAGNVVAGFDLVPITRSFDWDEPAGFTDSLAELLDVLFITHSHGDHYDEPLVRACLQRGKPVVMPGPMAATWAPNPALHAAGNGWTRELCGLRLAAREGIHLWRKAIGDVPLTYYEVACPQGFRFIFGGDVDYTKLFEKTPAANIDLFFLPWRNPNEFYEPGHPAQEATTIDAARIAIERIRPATMLYEHCAELDHVYEGYPASFDIALELQRQIPIPSELMFWGEKIALRS
jgi:L-ascorbate metabolism protein UlaG (beta-lactamase superfamily)